MRGSDMWLGRSKSAVMGFGESEGENEDVCASIESRWVNSRPCKYERRCSSLSSLAVTALSQTSAILERV